LLFPQTEPIRESDLGHGSLGQCNRERWQVVPVANDSNYVIFYHSVELFPYYRVVENYWFMLTALVGLDQAV